MAVVDMGERWRHCKEMGSLERDLWWIHGGIEKWRRHWWIHVDF